MGTPPETAMRLCPAPGASWALGLLALTLTLQVCQAYNIDRDTFSVERRGYRDPDDPRNLFAAMYGGNYKRSDPAVPQLSPEMFHYLKTLVHKRGLRDPYDPRNLFYSIYGGVFKR